MKAKTSKFGLLLATAIFALAQAVGAAVINYGNFSGTSVDYLGVTESSVTDPVPLYGAPTVSGNLLDFNPVGFAASANNGGLDFTDGQLNMQIQAKPTYGISQLIFSESGDFTLVGAGTANTYAQVQANFFIDVLAVDGVGLATPVSFISQMTFVPNANGTFTLVSNPGLNQLWAGSMAADLDAALDAANITYDLGATLVAVNLDNSLLAVTEAGTIAYIAKKDFKGFSITTLVVPEPSALALLLCGAVAWIGARRRSA